MKKHKFKPYKIRKQPYLLLNDAEKILFGIVGTWIRQNKIKKFANMVTWNGKACISSAGIFNRNDKHYIGVTMIYIKLMAFEIKADLTLGSG